MQYIEPSQWPRWETAKFFSTMEIPFYNVTFRVDVSRTYRYAKSQGLSFYGCCVYDFTRVLNSLDDFLYKLRGDRVIKHELLSPSYTVPADNGLFKIVSVDSVPGESCPDFCRRARAAELAQPELYPDAVSEARDDLIYMSCVPWLDFTSFTSETGLDRDDSIPRLTWGKLTREGEKATMPLSLQMNHRLIDGRHLGLLQDRIAEFMK